MDKLYSEEADNRIEFTKEKLKTDFDKWLVQVQCVDGRSIQQEWSPDGQIIVHLPWGEYGLYTQMLSVFDDMLNSSADPIKAAEIEAFHKECINELLTVNGVPRKMYSHTDDHSHGGDNSPFPCGCGHANLLDMESDYKLWAHKNYLAGLYNESTQHVLKWKHVEKAVVINTEWPDGRMISLKDNTINGDSDMVFTFDLSASNHLIDHMTDRLKLKLEARGIDPTDFAIAWQAKLMDHTMLTVWTHLWSARMHADAGRLYTATPVSGSQSVDFDLY